MSEKQVGILTLAVSEEALHDFDADSASIKHVEERFLHPQITRFARNVKDFGG